jgi:hypothetical protein
VVYIEELEMSMHREAVKKGEVKMGGFSNFKKLKNSEKCSLCKGL